MEATSTLHLAHRLERLRASAGSGSVALPAPPVVVRPPVADLARAVGGHVVDARGGPTVVVDSHVELDLDRAALARLPFGVDAGRPLIALDTETTGLATAAGTLAFLVGVGRFEGGTLHVHQLLLPDHSAEPGLLQLLADLIPANGWLVTYNGRSFDWPLLVARYRLHRRDPPPYAGHLDLLPVARRLWKHRLGNARLMTVEQAICRVSRPEDLPGALVPERYFAYLRDRQAERLRDVISHNRQDVVSLGLLLAALGRLARPHSWRAAHPGDVGALGRAYAKSGDHQAALDCLDAALSASSWQRGVESGGRLWRQLAVERARLLARLGRRDDAMAAWLEMARRGGPGAAAAWLRVARHRERVEHDPAGALAACVQSLDAAHRSRLWGRPVPAVERDLALRMARLRRRAGQPATTVRQVAA